MMKREQATLQRSKLLERFQDEETCRAMMSMLSLVANKSRFRILCLLTAGRFCVNDIVSLVGGKSSNISQQLKILALAGYVSSERAGKQIYYKLVDEKVRRLIEFLLDLAGV